MSGRCDEWMSGGGRAGAVANRYLPRPENVRRLSQSIIDFLIMVLVVKYIFSTAMK